MRLCPLPDNSHPEDACVIYKKPCVLKKEIWPGDESSMKEKSFQEWGHCWRARNSGTGNEHGCSDAVEHVFEFMRDNDTTLKCSRRLCCNLEDLSRALPRIVAVLHITWLPLFSHVLFAASLLDNIFRFDLAFFLMTGELTKSLIICQ